MLKFIEVCLLSTLAICTACWGGDSEVEAGLMDLQQAIESGNWEDVASCFSYPLSRPYPVPSVKSAEELVSRFWDILDDEIIVKLVRSEFETDWSQVGWRGYMLNNGIVWMGYDGKVKGINYSSAREFEIQAEMINADRKTVHRSLRDFEKPVLKWDTELNSLRIDKIGEDYRLAVWKFIGSFSETPNLLLNRGNVVFEGSGGNHYYTFREGDSEYRCEVQVLGKMNRIGSFSLSVGGSTFSKEEVVKSY